MKMFVGFKNDIWEVLAFNGMDLSYGRSTKSWLCRCFCGREVILTSQRITNKYAKSCGCYVFSRVGNKTNHESKIVHGLSGKYADKDKRQLYRNWNTMNQRCYNSNNISYKNYGAVGISICEEWRNPSTFIEWALSNGWKSGMSIDRTNSKGNYDPSNCTIMTKEENSRKVRIDNPLLHRGSNNKGARVNELIVSRIRELLSQDVMSCEIAKMFNIARSTVWAIKANRTWKHVK